MSNEMIIAVIDDGISEGVYNIRNLRKNLNISKDLQVVPCTEQDNITYSHGTICGGIINKYTEDPLVYSIKVLNEDSGKANKDKLIAAINWCGDNGVKIINLSLGTIDFRDFKEIEETINSIVAKGVIIVAASNNSDALTYPAYLSNVIGVKCDRELEESQYKFIEHPFDGVDIIASGKHELQNDRRNNTVPCNSFATPMITAKVYNILKENNKLTLEEIKAELRKGSIEEKSAFYNPYIQYDIDWVKKALLINVGKPANKTNVDCSINIVWEIDIEICNRESRTYRTKSLLDLIKKELSDKNLSSNINIYDAVIIYINDFISLNDKELLDIFMFFSQKGKGIVYLDNGKLSELIVETLIDSKTRIWTSNSYTDIVDNEIVKEMEIDIPIVVFEGYTKEDLIFLLSTFIELLRDLGYYAVGSMSDCRSILYGLEYIVEGINTKKFLEKLYGKYFCDIILLGLDREYSSKLIDVKNPSHVGVDIIISSDKSIQNSNGIVGEKNINFVIEAKDGLDKQSVLELFENIMDLLSE